MRRVKIFLLAAIAAAFLVCGCAQIQEEQQRILQESEQAKSAAIPHAKAAERGDVVSVYYTGRLENGSVFDSNAGGIPLRFTVGAGQMIAGFDRGVLGMEEEQEKTISIPAKDAYGEWSEGRVASIPLGKIEGGGKGIAVGAVLYASNGSIGRVIGVKNDSVVVDFNHELAGKTLIFTVRMLKIEKKGQ